jgi:hypothetical protein
VATLHRTGREAGHSDGYGLGQARGHCRRVGGIATEAKTERHVRRDRRPLSEMLMCLLVGGEMPNVGAEDFGRTSFGGVLDRHKSFKTYNYILTDGQPKRKETTET